MYCDAAGLDVVIMGGFPNRAVVQVIFYEDGDAAVAIDPILVEHTVCGQAVLHGDGIDVGPVGFTEEDNGWVEMMQLAYELVSLSSF